MQGIFEKIKESFEEVAWWTPLTFDCDGYSNDDSEEVITLDRAIEIVNQVAEEYAKTQLTADNSTYNSICSNSEIPNKSDGWIPVSERLPESNKKVLACSKDGGMEVDIYSQMSNKWLTASDAHVEVIAWQPLPEPFKPKGEQ